jgi:Tfp pilus assembly protein PilX
MIKILTKLILSLLFCCSCFGANVELSWNQNPTYEKIEYYTIFYGIQSETFTQIATVSSKEPKVSFVLKNLKKGTHYFRVTAHSIFGTSRWSSTKIYIKQ